MSGEIGNGQLITCFRRCDDDIILRDKRIYFLHDDSSHPAGIDIFYRRYEPGRTKSIRPPVLVLLDHLVIPVAACQFIEGSGRFHSDDQGQDIIAMQIVRKIHRDQSGAHFFQDEQRLFFGAVLVQRIDVVAGIGVEEGYDEEGGENLEGAARIVEARHSAGRGGAGGSGVHRVGRVGHGSFALGTASHGWVAAGAGSCEKYRGLCGCGCGCAFGRDDERLSCWMRCSRSRFPKGMTERKATAGAKAEATSEATAEAKAEAYSRRE